MDLCTQLELCLYTSYLFSILFMRPFDDDHIEIMVVNISKQSIEHRTMERNIMYYPDQAFSDSSGIETPSTDSFKRSLSHSSSESFTFESFTSMYSIYKTPWIIEEIARRAGNVFIDTTELTKLAKRVVEYMVSNYKEKQFDKITRSYLRLDYTLPNKDRILDYLFVLNALNFSLWIPNSTKQWSVRGKTGYQALMLALLRAIVINIPIWDPKYYSELPAITVKQLFEGDDCEIDIPLLEERQKVLTEIGYVLINKYEGTFKKCVESCQGDPDKLLHLLFNEFECFRDKAHYEELEVCLGTKAITLLGDLKTYGILNLDTRTIPTTMFADYRVPEVFLKFNILRYSNRLIDKFKQNELLRHGSKEELEIRCCSLVANNMLCKKVLLLCESYIKKVPVLENSVYSIPILVDNFLWKYRHKHQKSLKNDIPQYNTISEYY